MHVARHTTRPHPGGNRDPTHSSTLTHSSLKQRGARAEASRHRQRRRRAAAAAPPTNYVRTRAHATPEPQLAPQPRIASPGAPSCRGSPCAGTASRQRGSRHPPHPRPLVDPLHVHESRPIASLILGGEDGPRRVTCRGWSGSPQCSGDVGVTPSLGLAPPVARPIPPWPGLFDFLLFFRTLHRRLGKPRDGSLRVCRLHLSEQGGGVSGVASSSLYAYAHHMHGRAAKRTRALE